MSEEEREQPRAEEPAEDEGPAEAPPEEPDADPAEVGEPDDGEDAAALEAAEDDDAAEDPDGEPEEGLPGDGEEEGAAEEEEGAAEEEEGAAEEEGAEEEEEVPGKAKAGKGAVEAMLFVSSAPVTARLLASTLGKRVKESKVKEWLRELAQEYDETGRAFAVVEVAGGYRILTRPEYHDFIRKLLKSEKSNRLSEAALDTLSVVAYKQPILKADVNQIRGVESGPILKALAEKGLIRAVGRAETLGRPILYGTSRRFLEFFGLKSLKDLPKLEK